MNKRQIYNSCTLVFFVIIALVVLAGHLPVIAQEDNLPTLSQTYIHPENLFSLPMGKL